MFPFIFRLHLSTYKDSLVMKQSTQQFENTKHTCKIIFELLKTYIFNILYSYISTDCFSHSTPVSLHGKRNCPQFIKQMHFYFPHSTLGPCAFFKEDPEQNKQYLLIFYCAEQYHSTTSCNTTVLNPSSHCHSGLIGITTLHWSVPGKMMCHLKSPFE